jgi:hypothetical protein
MRLANASRGGLSDIPQLLLDACFDQESWHCAESGDCCSVHTTPKRLFTDLEQRRTARTGSNGDKDRLRASGVAMCGHRLPNLRVQRRREMRPGHHAHHIMHSAVLHGTRIKAYARWPTLATRLQQSTIHEPLSQLSVEPSPCGTQKVELLVSTRAAGVY